MEPRARGDGNGGQKPDRDHTDLTRAAGEDFLSSFAQLEGAVRHACSTFTEWEARVAVGIRAALEFAAVNPAAAQALTIRARGEKERDGNRQGDLIAHFTTLLSELTPAEKRFDLSTDEAIVRSIATMVRGHLLAGTAGQLPELTPDVVYLTLMPYLGAAGATRWAEAVHSDGAVQ
jgi:hypothetical protein